MRPFETLPTIHSFEDLPKFKINLPAKPSPDNSCMQASVGMILEALSPGDVPDLKTLELASHKREHLGTWPGWILSWLHDKGYSVDLYSNIDWNRFPYEPLELLERLTSNDSSVEAEEASTYLRDHNLQDGAESTKEMLARGILKESEIEIEEVFRRVQAGEFALVLLDFNHWVPITGFDGTNVFYNDPQKEGTTVDKKESLEDFLKRVKKFELFTVAIIGKK